MHLANLIGRTPNAVALRLVNFAAYDPDLKRRGISGMSHGGKVCKAFWDEFINDRERLLYESEQILAKFENHTIESKFKDDLHDIPQDVTGETRERMVKSRVNQNVFRQIVLSNYEGRCALTGIDIPELLVASHVIPWSEKKETRLNPANGICLSSIYDLAFDKGLMSFDKNTEVIFSTRLLSNVGKNYYGQYFAPIEHRALATPRKYPVCPDFLEWHRDCVFKG